MQTQVGTRIDRIKIIVVIYNSILVHHSIHNLIC